MTFRWTVTTHEPADIVGALVDEIIARMRYHEIDPTPESIGLIAKRVAERRAAGRIAVVNDEVYALSREAKAAFGG